MSEKAEKQAPGCPAAHAPETHARLQGEGVRQVAAGTRQSDVARARSIPAALLGSWQRQALVQDVPSSAERKEIKRLRAERKRVEMERDIFKKSRDHLCQQLPLS